MSTTIPHTPGPWHHEADGHTGAVKTETKQLIASVFGDDPECHEDARQIANARLIAAAPDLLAAAKDALAAWDDEENRITDIIAALEAPMEALRGLFAAIARAEEPR